MKSMQPLPHRCCFHSNGGSVALPVSTPALGRNIGSSTRCVIRDSYFDNKSFVILWLWGINNTDVFDF